MMCNINRPRRTLERVTALRGRAWLGFALAAGVGFSGCGGGGSNSGGGGGGNTTTPDMGTLTAVSDTNQYTLTNDASGMVLGISGQNQTAGTYVVQESASTTTADIDWHFMPMNNDEYNVENMLTHQVLGVSNASASAGAQVLQWADNGTNDHLWEFYLLGDGNYLIKNVNSGYYLEDANSGTSDPATIDQGMRATTGTGCTCQEWKLTSTGTAAYPAPMPVSGTGIYVHDPFMLQDPSTHIYWLYGTHQTLAYSTDLSTFTYTTLSTAYGACTQAEGTYWLTDDNHCPIIGPDFSSWTGLQTPPSDNNGKNIDVWAPSLLFANGTYYQYYAIPYEPSTGAEAVIGLAASNSPNGPWTDNGYVVTSWTAATSSVPSPNPWGFSASTTWNAIDPASFVDAGGNWWLVFGSWSDGIRVLQLQTPSTATSNATIGFPVSSNTSTWTKVAYRSVGEEGPYIYPWVVNGTQYYYYFAPINVCCAGTASTYREIVGRSTAPVGPFVDRGGIALTSGGGTILLSSHSNVYGPGGASVFTDTGSDGSKSLPTIVYHYYDGNNNGTPTLGINRLAFTSDGWPYVQEKVSFCMIVLFFVLVLTAASGLCAQEPPVTGNASSQSSAALPQNQMQRSSGGMANAGPEAAEFDSQHRPITAGGFVKTGPIVFHDIAAAAGLTAWHHQAGTPAKRLILEVKGPGVCLLDYDNDGWLDIYLVNGSTYDALDGKATPPHAALFHNNHDGTFTDVTRSAGIANDRWGYGCAVGDYDNDGWPDLYVTNYGKNRLYHNNHDGTFSDGAEKAGVAVGTWSTGAAFGDYDGDGRLDLFVAGYVQIDLANPPLSGTKAAGYTFCQFRGVPVMCGPRGLEGEHDHLFHNNGDGTFTDASKKLGVDDPNGYYGLGALFADVNNDGKPDLLVANDSTPNYLYINKGDGTFEDDSYMSGYAVNADGREVSNMGIAVGDYENNGHLSVVNTDFADDYNVLFQNDGTGLFTDVSYLAGIAESSIPFVGFADGFLDFDNDGWKDLLIINGHVYPQVDQHPEWGQSYAQRPLLYHNMKNGKFELVPAVEGTGLAKVMVGRGAAFGDLFNDGKIDVIINNMDGVPVLLRNVNPDRHHWVELKLIGGPKSPRDAVGATVYLTAGGIRQRGDVLSGGSYLSSNDMRVHFGLADAANVDAVEIHWPSGAMEKIRIPAVDRIYTITEAKGITGALCGGTVCEASLAGSDR